MMDANIREGQYGVENGKYEFVVREVNGGEVKIEYLSDGATLWVQTKRFNVDFELQ